MLAGTLPAHSGPRTSASYSIAVDIADAGGQRASSASYTNDGSAGSIAGISTIAAPAAIAKHGYIGQLFEIADFLVNAAAASVDEAGTLQLGAWHLLDDATFLAVPASFVAWSVESGPLTGLAKASHCAPKSMQAMAGSRSASDGRLVRDLGLGLW